jgi:hypothetical protein
MYQIAVTKVIKNRHSILPLVFAFLVGAFELIAGETSALKFTGTAERTSFRLDGKTIRQKSEGRFELDLDASGKWLMTSFSDPAPNTRFCIGYDGTNTTEMEYFSGEFADEDNNNKMVALTYETATSTASVYSGDEFPFDLWPTDQFAWLIFASKQYQNDTNHLGRIGDLFKRLEYDPIGFALKVVPTFSSNWPHVLKQAEFFFDLRDYPKNPIGLAVPENEMDFKIVNGLWAQMRSKTSGVKVGTLTSDLVKNFNGYSLPSRYKLEVTWRGNCVPDNAVGIDNLSQRIVLNLVDVQRIESVVGRPDFIGPGALVKDYRFRHVDDDSVMEYLGYNITDKKWKSIEDPILRMRAAHNRVNSPRFSNTRNRVVKLIGGVIIVLFCLLPLFAIIKKIKNKYEKKS